MFFFLIFNDEFILSYTLILLISQLQTLQLTTTQISSDVEYLIQTHYILVLILQSKLVKI